MLPLRNDFKRQTTPPVIFGDTGFVSMIEIRNTVRIKKPSWWARLRYRCWLWWAKRTGKYDRIMKKIKIAQQRINDELMYEALTGRKRVDDG